MFTFQNCELLAEGKVLQHQAAATAKSANDGSAPEPKQVKHGSPVIADGILGYVPMLLNSKVDGIVTRDKSGTLSPVPFAGEIREIAPISSNFAGIAAR